jgi:anti-sigma factor RsiW
MLRILSAVAVVILAVGVMLVGYNVLITGTGLVGALLLPHRYWRDFASSPGVTQNIQWMAIVVTALMLGWRAGSMREPGKY